MTVAEQWEVRCPSCKDDTQLEVIIKTGAMLTPDGTDIFEAANGDHEWDDESALACHSCGWNGQVKEAHI